MPEGQKIVKVEMIDGRPAYTVRDKDGTVQRRCMRRRYMDRAKPEGGWCQQNKLSTGVYCSRHAHGETHKVWRRLEAWAPGEVEISEGYELVGYWPATPGGDTFFVRTPKGIIRTACLRVNTSYVNRRPDALKTTRHARCMTAAGMGTHRSTGACKWHSGLSAGKGKTRVLNVMDPQYISFVGRAAKTNVAMEQIRDRIDLVRYAWYTFVDGLVRREKLLSNDEEYDSEETVDRSVGLTEILAAARNIVGITQLQNTTQKEVFKAAARVWSQQAYALQMTRLLAEISEEESPGSGQRIGRKSLEVMARRGLIKDEDKELPDPQQVALTTTKQVGTHQQELAMLYALGQKQQEYNYLVEAMGPKILSLYPLINVLNDMMVEEQQCGSPMDVKNKIMATITFAARQQIGLEKAMQVDLQSREARIISGEVIASVIEALEGEDELFLLAVLEQFQERHREFEVGKADVAGGLGKAIIDVKVSHEEQVAEDRRRRRRESRERSSGKTGARPRRGNR